MMQFRTARWKAMLAFSGCALFTVAAFDMGNDGDARGFYIAAFFAVSAAAGLWVLVAAPAIVTIDDDALAFHQGRKSWRLPWSEITDLRLFVVRTYGVKIRQNIVVTDRRGVQRWISSGLTISQVKLLELIRQHWLADGVVSPR